MCGGCSETSSTRGYGDFADSEIRVCLEVIFKIGTAVIMVFVCVFAGTSASFPSFLSASLSLQALRTFHTMFFFLPSFSFVYFPSLSQAVLSCFQAVLSHSLCFFSPTFHVSTSLSLRLLRNGRMCKTEVLECRSAS